MQDYDIKEFEEFVKANSDIKYRDFHCRLIKTKYTLNGVRIPILKKYAKELAKNRDMTAFFNTQSTCYEECMLKGILLSYMKIEECRFFILLEKFLNEADDWSLIDVGCCGIHRKDDIYLTKVVEYARSNDIWFARWGLVALLVNFTDRDDIIYNVVDNLVAKDYYVDMALAWLIQVLAVKNKNVAINLLQSNKVSGQVKKFAVRKIKDSFRISKDEKLYLEEITKG